MSESEREGAMTKNSEDLTSRITSDPAVCGGKPCVRGTRIPVHLVLDLFAAGEDEETVRSVYPTLDVKDIRACLQYAAVLTEEEASVRR